MSNVWVCLKSVYTHVCVFFVAEPAVVQNAVDQNRKIHESFFLLVCFSLVCCHFLLDCFKNLEMSLRGNTEWREEEQNVRRGVQASERIFQFAGAARKPYPLENKCKQAEQRGADGNEWKE